MKNKIHLRECKLFVFKEFNVGKIKQSVPILRIVSLSDMCLYLTFMCINLYNIMFM